ncbi:hypothetical protein RMATCC62417_10551 [Rhizopus microsporus]|nr:hypothetical protein RMATCC62417_10551 [Rhizopus microsporus]
MLGFSKITTPFRLFYRMTSTLSKPTSLIIEQTNPLESSKNAIYSITTGTTSFHEFILNYPRGAYTGMRTLERNAIVEFDAHLRRLTNSLALLKWDHKDDHINQAMASFKDPIELKGKLVPLLKKGLESFYEQINTEHETKVSVMIAYSFQEQKPRFAAHFTRLDPILQDRVKVRLEHRSRSTPEVKDSRWVRERADLEENKPKDVNEIVLVDSEDKIYEGMASNFLAVRRDEYGQPVVMCAGLEHVLLGTILRLLVDICEKHHITFDWSFPKLQDAREGKWEGCFITSTSRLLLPVETIYCSPNEKIEFKEHSEIIEFLRQQIMQELASTAYKIL